MIELTLYDQFACPDHKTEILFFFSSLLLFLEASICIFLEALLSFFWRPPDFCLRPPRRIQEAICLFLETSLKKSGCILEKSEMPLKNLLGPYKKSGIPLKKSSDLKKS